MNHLEIIIELENNKAVFAAILKADKPLQTWKPQPHKWCLLEIVCHLFDEEREDFRARVKHVLETPQQPLPSIDPQGWVMERRYMEQDFGTFVNKFLKEREHSIDWLRSLKNPEWKNTTSHPRLGEMAAELFLANWLAHDYLHFRQITRLKYQYHLTHSGVSLDYAGEW